MQLYFYGLGLPNRAELFENAIQTEEFENAGSRIVSTENILKTELFENHAITIIT